MRILVISVGYPSGQNKARLVFLQRLVNKFADKGHECTVIAPVRFMREDKNLDLTELQPTENGNQVRVFFPRYIGGWMDKKSPLDAVYKLTVRAYANAALQVIRKNNIEFDCVYAHFTGFASLCAVSIGKAFGVPVFAAAGESKFVSLEGYNRAETVKALNRMSGIISVSAYNKQILLENGVLDDDSIITLPNGADEKRFYPRDKAASREALGLPGDAFIAAFVGHFIERKGPLRLLSAAEGTGVKLAFAGKGPQTPEGDSVVYCGPVAPEQMPEFLSAADVFVLPTLTEGCCNAIVESICCEIPVISSDRPFNYDVLDPECSIMVDPENVEALREAILRIKNEPDLYKRLRDGTRQKKRVLSLDYRADAILSWIGKRIRQN
ncbi:MAG: glycosyltransferase family 4 protein [Abditibacteriota bacterium]|nr:glycosyltransferase family 4 protein [Abditibacteriota bacterium]